MLKVVPRPLIISTSQLAVPREADLEVAEYLNILSRIDETKINSNVSIKLTQFGLGLDHELAYKNARRIVEEAHTARKFCAGRYGRLECYPGDDRYLQTTARGVWTQRRGHRIAVVSRDEHMPMRRNLLSCRRAFASAKAPTTNHLKSRSLTRKTSTTTMCG